MHDYTMDSDPEFEMFIKGFPKPGRDYTIHDFTVVNPSVTIGTNCIVWHFTTICEHVVLGQNVSIGSHCFIGAETEIGAGSRLQSHVFLPRKTMIGRDVFIGPGVICTDDRYPQVNVDYDADAPWIQEGASIGAGAVILPGVTIGAGAMIGAGAIVTHSVPAGKMVRGDPARQLLPTGKPKWKH